MKRKIIYILILLLMFFISPIIGAFIILGIIIYYLFKYKRKNNTKDKFSNSKVKEFLLSLISNKYEKILFKEDIKIYQTENGLTVYKEGFKWKILLIISIKIPPEKEISFSKLSELTQELNFKLLIDSVNEIKIIIKEEIVAVKLSKSLLETKVSSLAGKARFIVSYFETLNCEINFSKGLNKDAVQL